MSRVQRLPFSARIVASGVFALAALMLAGSTWADAADAHIAKPEDTPYPGTLQIHVDASDTRHGIFRVHETIPVQAGELTLLYPKWIPGNHSPSGPIDMLAGLKITANGKALKWKRDKYDVYAFHVDVPQGAASLDVFEVEPLPQESPLWALDNCFVTPHIAAASSEQTGVAYFSKAIRDHEAGLPLPNVVDATRGY